MKRRVVIDCFPESGPRYVGTHAVVAVDVIRATTTAVTALALGRRVFPARDAGQAWELAAGLSRPLLAGEKGGVMPQGFHIQNSPAELAARRDAERPLVLVSSSGIPLLVDCQAAEAVYAVCLRNLSAAARWLAARHHRVAVIGAGSRGQFRREDQLACAWLAQRLMDLGFDPQDRRTADMVKAWQGADPETVRQGRSAAYLRRSDQEADLEFILSHLDDLGLVPVMQGGELVAAGEGDLSRLPAAAAMEAGGQVWASGQAPAAR